MRQRSIKAITPPKVGRQSGRRSARSESASGRTDSGSTGRSRRPQVSAEGVGHFGRPTFGSSGQTKGILRTGDAGKDIDFKWATHILRGVCFGEATPPPNPYCQRELLPCYFHPADGRAAPDHLYHPSLRLALKPYAAFTVKERRCHTGIEALRENVVAELPLEICSCPISGGLPAGVRPLSQEGSAGGKLTVAALPRACSA